MSRWPPSRGLILDRHGEPLALNRPPISSSYPRADAGRRGHPPRLGNRLLADADLERTRRASGRAAASMPCRSACSSPRRNWRASPSTRRFPRRGSASAPDPPLPAGRPPGVHALGYVAASARRTSSGSTSRELLGTTLIGKLRRGGRALESELHGETGYQQLLVNAQSGVACRARGLSTPDLTRREPWPAATFISARRPAAAGGREHWRPARPGGGAIDPRNATSCLRDTPTFDPNGFARA